MIRFSLILLLALAACAPGPAIPDALRGPVEKAKADLASREGVAPGSIEVRVAEPQTWPDASLGCPQPGRFYAQVITEGYRIVLATDSGEYSYHGATGRDPILCQN